MKLKVKLELNKTKLNSLIPLLKSGWNTIFKGEEYGGLATGIDKRKNKRKRGVRERTVIPRGKVVVI